MTAEVSFDALEWDEAKRAANKRKHGFDFEDALPLLRDDIVVVPAWDVDNELRSLAIGIVAGVYVTAIFTRRGRAIRVISMRRARRNERRKHQALFGR